MYENIRIGSDVSIIRCKRNKDTDVISVTYCGTGRGLLAAGLVSTKTLAMNGPAGKRKKRIDSGGFPFSLQSSWRGTDADEPYRIFELTFHRPVARIAELPGATEALAAHDAHEADRTAPERTDET